MEISLRWLGLRLMMSAQQLPLEGHDRSVMVVISVFEMVDGVI